MKFSFEVGRSLVYDRVLIKKLDAGFRQGVALRVRDAALKREVLGEER